jgi:hypothetical protein
MASDSAATSHTDQSAGDQVNPTNAPISEDERAVTREREKALRRPFPWIAIGTLLVLAALAVVAALTAGSQYAIPVALVAVVGALFVGGHRMLAATQTRHYDEEPGREQDEAADDADDPVPTFGFDEQSQMGSTAQLSDEESQSHADMDRSTGQR